MSNETAVGIISFVGVVVVAIIAWLTRDKSPKPSTNGQATLPPNPVDDYEKLSARLLAEIARLSKRVEDLETERETREQERQKERAEASHLRERVVELEASEKKLKAEVAQLRGLVESKPGTGPLGKKD